VVFAVDVLLGRMTRNRFSPAAVNPRGSWTLFIQICVDRCPLILSVGSLTSSPSLMTTIGRLGPIS
jgi:hypothetical protein